MAEPGFYYCVVNNSAPLPIVVHSSIQPGTEEGLGAAQDHAVRLSDSSRGTVPFAVSKIVHGPGVTFKAVERALELYPVEDGSYPGVDRNADARAAYMRGITDGW